MRDAWKRVVLPHLDKYEETVDLLDDESSPALATDAEEALLDGFQVAYVGERDLAHRFFGVACRQAERAIKRDTLAIELDRATVARVLALASVARGDEMPAASLKESSADYREWALRFSGPDWDAQAQAYYLNAIRLLVLAGERAQAGALFESAPPLKWHREELAILKKMISGEVVEQTELWGYLDKLRDPEHPPDYFVESQLVCVELLACWYKTRDGTVDWEDVIARISE